MPARKDGHHPARPSKSWVNRELIRSIALLSSGNWPRSCWGGSRKAEGSDADRLARTAVQVNGSAPCPGRALPVRTERYSVLQALLTPEISLT